MLVDSSLRSSDASCQCEHFADQRLGLLFQRMVDCPDISLDNLLMDRGKGEVLRIVEAMFTRRGREKFFLWNFNWHCHSVRELGEKRIEFGRSLNFVLDNMVLNTEGICLGKIVTNG
jgi:hypothetical protein